MSAADRYHAAVHPLADQILETDLTGFDRVGIPVWSVVVLGDVGGSGIGYGSDRDAARTSAFGELVEGLRSTRSLSARPCRRESYRFLRAEGAVDPRTLCLPAGSTWTDDTPVDWLRASRYQSGEPVWVPAELAASRAVDLPGAPAAEQLTTVIGNGLGAGFDLDRALSHALLELLQRDGNGLRFRALDRGVVVDLTGLRDAASLDAIAALRHAGIEPLVKLAATDFGLVNVYAVGIDTEVADQDDGEPLRVTACGEACHPDRDVAVRKALLELCSSRARKAFMHGSLERVRKIAGDDYLETYLTSIGPRPAEEEEPRALAEMARWVRMRSEDLNALQRDTALSRQSDVAFLDLPTRPHADNTSLLADVASRLSNAGFDPLLLDLSGDGVNVVKALVPGLEVETMSYGRIGERGVRTALDLALPFVHVGTDPGGWSRVLITPEAEERLGGPAWLDRDGVDAAVGPLYPLYREPSRHVTPLSLLDDR